MTLLKKQINSLTNQQALAFSILIVKRLALNYLFFTLKEKWGNFQPITVLIHMCEDFLKGELGDLAPIKSFKYELLEIAPDSEQFGAVYSAYALDTCAACSDLIMFIEGDYEAVERILDLSTNTVYISIVDRLKTDNEDIVFSDNQMKVEIEFQTKLIKEILNEKSIDELIKRVIKTPLQSNIGLKV